MEVCLQVKARGYKVLFDFQNKVQHYPTGLAYSPGRDGDLQVKIYNGAYNYAFVLGKHTPWHLRAVRLGYLLASDLSTLPEYCSVAGDFALRAPGRELSNLLKTWQSHIAGWRAGSKRRASTPGPGAATDSPRLVRWPQLQTLSSKIQETLKPAPRRRMSRIQPQDQGVGYRDAGCRFDR